VKSSDGSLVMPPLVNAEPKPKGKNLEKSFLDEYER
jgi:hypothetical protein